MTEITSFSTIQKTVHIRNLVLFGHGPLKEDGKLTTAAYQQTSHIAGQMQQHIESNRFDLVLSNTIIGCVQSALNVSFDNSKVLELESLTHQSDWYTANAFFDVLEEVGAASLSRENKLNVLVGASPACIKILGDSFIKRVPFKGNSKEVRAALQEQLDRISPDRAFAIVISFDEGDITSSVPV